jgi:anti-sigma factor RsiW
MSCEEVREQLPDYSLGTLSDIEAAALRRHLRGCAGCRAEATKLDEGVGLFASAAHAMDPPEDLKDKVLHVLDEEWQEAPEQKARVRRLGFVSWPAVAAVLVLLAGALVWGGVAQSNAGRFQADATSYQQFLHALGGKDVRVATLAARSSQVIQGSAVLYDSDRGQSWALVMAHAPGYSGSLNVVLSAPGGRTISLRAIELDANGEGSTWLVTAADISSFKSVRLTDASGHLLASGTVVER